jgi:hypothetical protein
LEQEARPQSKPDPVKPAEHRQDTQFRQELSKTPKSVGADFQSVQHGADQGPASHRGDSLASRSFPIAQVEVERSPVETSPKQPKQTLPNPEKQSLKVNASTPTPQIEPRPLEAFPTSPTLAQQVFFEDGGSLPISIVGAEGAPRGQLPTPPQALPQPMPQHTVPADELSQMLRGLTHQRAGSEVTTTELILEPMELGRIRVTLSGSESSGQITILVERGETLELVKRHLDLVRADLRAGGWEATEFSLSRESFSSFDETDPREAGQRDESEEVQSDSQEAVELTRPEVARDLTNSGGLDLRV